MSRPVAVSHGDHGTGVFSTAWAFTAFIVFLLFTAQLLFGLYARTTVTAVATDLAQHAAESGTFDAASLDRHRAEARQRLGRYGDDASFDISVLDADGDGADDTVAVRVQASLPSLLPLRWSAVSPSSFTRTVRARIEQLGGEP